MPLTTTAKNSMLDGLGITQVSLHTASPGESGTNEVTGGTYARKAVTFASASGGAISQSNQPVFDVPAGSTVSHVGFWASATFVAYATVTSESFANDGTYTLTDSDLDLNG